MDKHFSVLNKVNSPADLKPLNETERKQLADEVRATIIDTVSKTGGHLASNLGAVELTIALHSVFDSPSDKLIWDVSHQCYTHKLLTGRREFFSTLRQSGGISGFTKREESEHDSIGAGHASTSISAALGLAKARDLRGGKEHVIAVIGDGAITGGLALEGMNNAAQLKTDVIVVLNDNKMSIAENVGGMALHLSKLRMAELYQKVESRAKETLEKMPAGKTLTRTAEGLSHGVTRLLGSKTGVVFEELGFTYLGPIDGHNTEVLIDVFENAKRLKGPLLIHVVTQKGKGYEFAENNARVFHGISGFDVSDGNIERATGNASYTKVFSETLIELAKQDKRIVAITAAMPDGTGLARFAEAYPDRFFDVGIAEEHAVTFAAGLAAGGLRPVVAFYSTFLQRAYDQIVHDVCLQNLPVTFAVDRAGVVGEDGPTHHGVFDLSYLRHIPRLVVAAPKDTMELRDLLATALTHDGPMAVRYPRGGGPCVYECSEPQILAIGKGERLIQGDDLAIIAVGSTVYSSVAAAGLLAERGLSVEVINARFVKPLDEQLILSVFQRGLPVMVVEDNTIVGGFGSAILELASSKGYPLNSVSRIGVPDAFVDHDTPESLYDVLGLSADRIAQAAMSILTTIPGSIRAHYLPKM
ncbi:MAG: 1-deoxy-D-xylulose-5-phosphate synthase [Armatimonadota bacterium]